MDFIDKLIDFLDPLGGLAKVCGIAGISLGILLIILKALIKKSTFSTLTQNNTFRIMRLIVWICFGTAILGVMAYVFLQTQVKPIEVTKIQEDSLKYEPLKLERKGAVIVDSLNKRR